MKTLLRGGLLCLAAVIALRADPPPAQAPAEASSAPTAPPETSAAPPEAPAPQPAAPLQPTAPVLAPTTPPEDPRHAAKREAWTSTVLITSLLEQGDNHAFPGIRAWLDDFRAATANMPAPESDKPFPPVDTDALVTHNPHFWSTFYEVQPGDPGLALLHAALLLSGGEAQRAAALAAFGLQRPGIPEEIKRALNALLGQCRAAQAHSDELMHEGVRLHDARDFAGALKKFDEAIAEWPGNGDAHFERGSTLRLQAIAGAQRAATGTETAELPSDPPETVACFARARCHDPFQLLAYQGDSPVVRDGLMALVRAGLPVWESIRKRPDQTLRPEHLQALADSCRTAGIDDFALAARQIVVADKRRYDTDDEEFIKSCLLRLAPAALASPQLLARIGGEPHLPARQIVVPSSVESPELAQAGYGEASGADSEPKSKRKGKGGSSAKSTKHERASETEAPAHKPKKKHK